MKDQLHLLIFFIVFRNHMFVIVTGFMGAGKSTFLSLAEKFLKNYKGGPQLEWDFVDLDNYLEKSFQKSIPQLFKQGEDKFREIEFEKLQELIILYSESNKNLMLSLGGGGLHQLSFDFLHKKRAYLIWIETPIEICLERIENDSNRPLACQNKNLITDLYQKRITWYQKANKKISGQIEFGQEIFKNILLNPQS